MTLMRRVVTVVVAVAAVLQSGASGASERFSDVSGGHAYGIEQVVRLGIDEGCGDGRFCPDEPISRAEMAAWLYQAAASLNPPRGWLWARSSRTYPTGPGI